MFSRIKAGRSTTLIPAIIPVVMAKSPDKESSSRKICPSDLPLYEEPEEVFK